MRGSCGSRQYQLQATRCPDPDHPVVTNFLPSQGRTMNYREEFNNVKQAQSFCWEHLNSLDLQGVYHPQEYHCATAT